MKRTTCSPRRAAIPPRPCVAIPKRPHSNYCRTNSAPVGSTAASTSASNPGQQAVYDFSARALDALLSTDARLLDLGVGSGRALSALLRRRPDVRATAVDLAPNMLATAEQLF